MKIILASVLAALGLSLFASGCSDAGSRSGAEANLASCSEAHLDKNGVCRNADGTFAKKSCCTSTQQACGSNTCSAGEYCCNVSCGICAPEGGACTQEVCETGGGSCGGIAGTPCKDSEYCAYTPNQQCGAADQMGTCKPRPDACTEICASPMLCGCDGKAYCSDCHAHAAGVDVSGETGSCGDAGGSTCDELGGVCKSSPTDVTFPANCEQDFGTKTLDGTCEALNQSCCGIIDP